MSLKSVIVIIMYLCIGVGIQAAADVPTSVDSIDPLLGINNGMVAFATVTGTGF